MRLVRSLPIVRKIMVVLGAFIVLTIGSSGVAVYNMANIASGYTQLIENEGTVALYLSRAHHSFLAAGAAIDELTTATTDEGNAVAMADLKNAQVEMEDFAMTAEAASPDDAPMIDSLWQKANQVLDVPCAETIRLGHAGTGDAVLPSQAVFLNECSPRFPAISKQFSAEVERAVDRQGEASAALATKTHATAVAIVTTITGSLMLLALVAYLGVRSWISAPLKSLDNTMQSLAAGDPAVDVQDPTRKDEVAAMSRTVQGFKDAIEELRLEQQPHDRRQAAEQARTARVGASGRGFAVVASDVRALAQVNTAVNQMDHVTQQNAAMVEQSTAASRFKLKVAPSAPVANRDTTAHRKTPREPLRLVMGGRARD